MKIPNWSRDDGAYPAWEHDETGQSIEIGPDDQTEYRADGNPKNYQITFWNGLNNHVAYFSITSLREAKQLARKKARDNPDGDLIKSMDKKYHFV